MTVVDRFDAIVLDLFWGECGIGLASVLDAPIVGYWGMTPSGMWMDYTSASTNPRRHSQHYNFFLLIHSLIHSF